MCFTNTLTKLPTSRYEAEVVQDTLDTTLATFKLQWERRGTFTSFCYLNSLMFWVMEKSLFCLFKHGLNETHTPWTERMCAMRPRLGSVFMQVVGWGQKSLRVRAKAHWTAVMCFFICTTIFVLPERETNQLLMCLCFNDRDWPLSHILNKWLQVY